MNAILSFCNCRLSGGDTQTVPAVTEKIEISLTPEPPGETFTVFSDIY